MMTWGPFLACRAARQEVRDRLQALYSRDYPASDYGASANVTVTVTRHVPGSARHFRAVVRTAQEQCDRRSTMVCDHAAQTITATAWSSGSRSETPSDVVFATTCALGFTVAQAREIFGL